MDSDVRELSITHVDLTIKCPFSLALWYRLEIQLQQNQIMDLFVDDCRALSDEDWITGTNSGTHLKVYTHMDFLKEQIILHAYIST